MSPSWIPLLDIVLRYFERRQERKQKTSDDKKQAVIDAISPPPTPVAAEPKPVEDPPMAKFSTSSQYQLSTCHPDLRRLFNVVITIHDCTVIQGYRSLEEQAEKYAAGTSKVLQGKHNVTPSDAVDVGPYLPERGIPWPQPGSKTYTTDIQQFYYFAGIVMATAHAMGIKLRWGGDWDRDHDLADNKFDDLVHFELVDKNGG